MNSQVQHAVQQCTCPKQFPLINVSRGKYRIGYTQNVVFVRVSYQRERVFALFGTGYQLFSSRFLKDQMLDDTDGKESGAVS